MSFIIREVILAKLLTLDFTNPFVYIDLGIALFLIIGTLSYMRRFPSFRVLLGTLFLFGISIIFYLADFIFTATVLGFFSIFIFISLPLIFSQEIRHYLGKLGRFHYLRNLKLLSSQKNNQFIHTLVDSCFELAERSIGGTLVIVRATGLEQTIETGIMIDSIFSSKLLQNIFFPKSPLHDGAVIIRHERILAVNCLLPVRGEVKLDPPFGTRHRSGLAITTDTDAVVLIISEQRGEVSLAENGKLHVNLDRATLTEMLNELL